MIEKLNGFLALLKSASKFDIFLIVFISLPFVLEQWLKIVKIKIFFPGPPVLHA